MRSPEGGPRGEYGGFGRSESPRINALQDMRSEAKRLRWETTDELTRLIAEKIVGKIDAKEMAEQMFIGAHDITLRQPDMKKLGLLAVREEIARTDWSPTTESAFELFKGDKYLDLHIPPVRFRDRTSDNFSRSLEMVAQYIAHHNLDPKYVMGVTFGRLARSAQRRYGFHIEEPEIPAQIRQGVLNVVQRFHPRRTELPKIFVCYQTTEEFMARFLPANT